MTDFELPTKDVPAEHLMYLTDAIRQAVEPHMLQVEIHGQVFYQTGCMIFDSPFDAPAASTTCAPMQIFEHQEMPDAGWRDVLTAFYGNAGEILATMYRHPYRQPATFVTVNRSGGRAGEGHPADGFTICYYTPATAEARVDTYPTVTDTPWTVSDTPKTLAASKVYEGTVHALNPSYLMAQAFENERAKRG